MLYMIGRVFFGSDLNLGLGSQDSVCLYFISTMIGGILFGFLISYDYTISRSDRSNNAYMLESIAVKLSET